MAACTVQSLALALVAFLAGGLHLQGSHEGEELSSERDRLDVDLYLRDLRESLRPSNSSDGPTVVFIAGVEGSGHHFLAELLHHSAKFAPIASLNFPPEWECGSEWQAGGKIKMIQTFRLLKQASAYDNQGTIYLLPPERAYPEGGNRDLREGSHDHEKRMMLHPRLQWITEAAKEGGVKLKVLLLRRNLWQCLVEDCVHRHLEKCHDEAAVLKHQALLLVADIHKFVSPHDTMCFEYGNVKLMQAALHKIGLGNATDALMEHDFQAFDHTGEHDWTDWESDKKSLEEADHVVKGTCHAQPAADHGKIPHWPGFGPR